MTKVRIREDVYDTSFLASITDLVMRITDRRKAYPPSFLSFAGKTLRFTGQGKNFASYLTNFFEDAGFAEAP